jgi:hypothetical protein
MRQEPEPQEGDYMISDGRSPGETNVGVYQEDGVSSFLGSYPSRSFAWRAIYDTMQREQFFPNVFWVSDHGNVSLDTGYIKKARQWNRRKVN